MRRATVGSRYPTASGAVHSGWGMCELDAKGHVNQHLQSFEKSFYVLEGNPVLILDNRAFRLAPGACGLIPVGMKQAWLGPESGTAKWIDMNTPVPKGVNFADDTYFLGPPPQVSDRSARHPRPDLAAPVPDGRR